MISKYPWSKNLVYNHKTQNTSSQLLNLKMGRFSLMCIILCSLKKKDLFKTPWNIRKTDHLSYHKEKLNKLPKVEILYCINETKN